MTALDYVFSKDRKERARDGDIYKLVHVLRKAGANVKDELKSSIQKHKYHRPNLVAKNNARNKLLVLLTYATLTSSAFTNGGITVTAGKGMITENNLNTALKDVMDNFKNMQSITVLIGETSKSYSQMGAKSAWQHAISSLVGQVNENDADQTIRIVDTAQVDAEEKAPIADSQEVSSLLADLNKAIEAKQFTMIYGDAVPLMASGTGYTGVDFTKVENYKAEISITVRPADIARSDLELISGKVTDGNAKNLVNNLNKLMGKVDEKLTGDNEKFKVTSELSANTGKFAVQKRIKDIQDRLFLVDDSEVDYSTDIGQLKVTVRLLISSGVGATLPPPTSISLGLFAPEAIKRLNTNAAGRLNVTYKVDGKGDRKTMINLSNATLKKGNYTITFFTSPHNFEAYKGAAKGGTLTVMAKKNKKIHSTSEDTTIGVTRWNALVEDIKNSLTGFDTTQQILVVNIEGKETTYDTQDEVVSFLKDYTPNAEGQLKIGVKVLNRKNATVTIDTKKSKSSLKVTLNYDNTASESDYSTQFVKLTDSQKAEIRNFFTGYTNAFFEGKSYTVDNLITELEKKTVEKDAVAQTFSISKALDTKLAEAAANIHLHLTKTAKEAFSCLELKDGDPKVAFNSAYNMGKEEYKISDTQTVYRGKGLEKNPKTMFVDVPTGNEDETSLELVVFINQGALTHRYVTSGLNLDVAKKQVQWTGLAKWDNFQELIEKTKNAAALREAAAQNKDFVMEFEEVKGALETKEHTTKKSTINLENNSTAQSLRLTRYETYGIEGYVFSEDAQNKRVKISNGLLAKVGEDAVVAVPYSIDIENITDSKEQITGITMIILKPDNVENPNLLAAQMSNLKEWLRLLNAINKHKIEGKEGWWIIAKDDDPFRKDEKEEEGEEEKVGNYYSNTELVKLLSTSKLESKDGVIQLKFTKAGQSAMNAKKSASREQVKKSIGELLKLDLSKVSNVDSEDAKNYDILSARIQEKFDTKLVTSDTVVDDETGITMFCSMVKLGNIALVKHMIKSAADVNVTYGAQGSKKTALHVALGNDFKGDFDRRVEMVKVLRLADADLTAKINGDGDDAKTVKQELVDSINALDDAKVTAEQKAQLSVLLDEAKVKLEKKENKQEYLNIDSRKTIEEYMNYELKITGGLLKKAVFETELKKIFSSTSFKEARAITILLPNGGGSKNIAVIKEQNKAKKVKAIQSIIYQYNFLKNGTEFIKTGRSIIIKCKIKDADVVLGQAVLAEEQKISPPEQKTEQLQEKQIQEFKPVVSDTYTSQESHYSRFKKFIKSTDYANWKVLGYEYKQELLDGLDVEQLIKYFESEQKQSDDEWKIASEVVGVVLNPYIESKQDIRERLTLSEKFCLMYETYLLKKNIELGTNESFQILYTTLTGLGSKIKNSADYFYNTITGLENRSTANFEIIYNQSSIYSDSIGDHLRKYKNQLLVDKKMTQGNVTKYIQSLDTTKTTRDAYKSIVDNLVNETKLTDENFKFNPDQISNYITIILFMLSKNSYISSNQGVFNIVKKKLKIINNVINPAAMTIPQRLFKRLYKYYVSNKFSHSEVTDQISKIISGISTFEIEKKYIAEAKAKAEDHGFEIQQYPISVSDPGAMTVFTTENIFKQDIKIKDLTVDQRSKFAAIARQKINKLAHTFRVYYGEDKRKSWPSLAVIVEEFKKKKISDAFLEQFDDNGMALISKFVYPYIYYDMIQKHALNYKDGDKILDFLTQAAVPEKIITIADAFGHTDPKIRQQKQVKLLQFIIEAMEEDEKKDQPFILSDYQVDFGIEFSDGFAADEIPLPINYRAGSGKTRTLAFLSNVIRASLFAEGIKQPLFYLHVAPFAQGNEKGWEKLTNISVQLGKLRDDRKTLEDARTKLKQLQDELIELEKTNNPGVKVKREQVETQRAEVSRIETAQKNNKLHYWVEADKLPGLLQIVDVGRIVSNAEIKLLAEGYSVLDEGDSKYYKLEKKGTSEEVYYFRELYNLGVVKQIEMSATFNMDYYQARIELAKLDLQKAQPGFKQLYKEVEAMLEEDINNEQLLTTKYTEVLNLIKEAALLNKGKVIRIVKKIYGMRIAMFRLIEDKKRQVSNGYLRHDDSTYETVVNPEGLQVRFVVDNTLDAMHDKVPGSYLVELPSQGVAYTDTILEELKSRSIKRPFTYMYKNAEGHKEGFTNVDKDNEGVLLTTWKRITFKEFEENDLYQEYAMLVYTTDSAGGDFIKFSEGRAVHQDIYIEDKFASNERYQEIARKRGEKNCPIRIYRIRKRVSGVLSGDIKKIQTQFASSFDKIKDKTEHKAKKTAIDEALTKLDELRKKEGNDVFKHFESLKQRIVLAMKIYVEEKAEEVQEADDLKHFITDETVPLKAEHKVEANLDADNKQLVQTIIDLGNLLGQKYPSIKLEIRELTRGFASVLKDYIQTFVVEDTAKVEAGDTLSDLQKSKTDKQSEISRIEGEIKSIETGNAARKSKIVTLERSMKSAKQSLDVMKKDIMKDEKAMETKNKTLSELGNNADAQSKKSIQSDIKALNVGLVRKNTRLKINQNEYDRLKSKLSEQQKVEVKSTTELSDSLGTLQEKLNDLESEIAKNSGISDELELKRKSKSDEMQDNFNALVQTIDESLINPAKIKFMTEAALNLAKIGENQTSFVFPIFGQEITSLMQQAKRLETNLHEDIGLETIMITEEGKEITYIAARKKIAKFLSEIEASARQYKSDNIDTQEFIKNKELEIKRRIYMDALHSLKEEIRTTIESKEQDKSIQNMQADLINILNTVYAEYALKKNEIYAETDDKQFTERELKAFKDTFYVKYNEYFTKREQKVAVYKLIHEMKTKKKDNTDKTLINYWIEQMLTMHSKVLAGVKGKDNIVDALYELTVDEPTNANKSIKLALKDNIDSKVESAATKDKIAREAFDIIIYEVFPGLRNFDERNKLIVTNETNAGELYIALLNGNIALLNGDIVHALKTNSCFDVGSGTLKSGRNHTYQNFIGQVSASKDNIINHFKYFYTNRIQPHITSGVEEKALKTRLANRKRELDKDITMSEKYEASERKYQDYKAKLNELNEQRVRELANTLPADAPKLDIIANLTQLGVLLTAPMRQAILLAKRVSSAFTDTVKQAIKTGAEEQKYTATYLERPTADTPLMQLRTKTDGSKELIYDSRIVDAFTRIHKIVKNATPDNKQVLESLTKTSIEYLLEVALSEQPISLSGKQENTLKLIESVEKLTALEGKFGVDRLDILDANVSIIQASIQGVFNVSVTSADIINVFLGIRNVYKDAVIAGAFGMMFEMDGKFYPVTNKEFKENVKDDFAAKSDEDKNAILKNMLNAKGVELKEGSAFRVLLTNESGAVFQTGYTVGDGNTLVRGDTKVLESPKMGEVKLEISLEFRQKLQQMTFGPLMFAAIGSMEAAQEILVSQADDLPNVKDMSGRQKMVDSVYLAA
ncbi:hypothetical protein ACFL4A_03655 [bacterium]